MEENKNPIQDCAIHQIKSLSNQSYPYPRNPEARLIGPGGMILVTTKIPESFRTAEKISFHAPSSNARWLLQEWGADRGIRKPGDPPFPEEMSVFLQNRGNDVLCINSNTRIVAVNHTKIIREDPTFPASNWRMHHRENTITLYAGDTKLRTRKENLPEVWIEKLGYARYINLDDKNMEDFSEQVYFSDEELAHGVKMNPGDSLVFPASNEYVVPRGKIGVVHSIDPRLTHLSAIFIYAEVHSFLTLEMTAVSPVHIFPGMRVAILTLHQFPWERDRKSRYDGKYSSAPRFLE